MPAHISFFKKFMSYPMAAQINAAAVGGNIKERLGFEATHTQVRAMELIEHYGGMYPPSEVRYVWQKMANRDRTFKVYTYGEYRVRLDTFKPKGGVALGGHRAAPTEWDMYLAAQTHFDLTIKSILDGNNRKESNPVAPPSKAMKVLGWHAAPGGVTQGIPKACVLLITEIDDRSVLKRIEVDNDVDETIIAWTRV